MRRYLKEALSLTDDVWSGTLGVDVVAVDAVVSQPQALAEWLSRFSAPFLTYLARREGLPVSLQTDKAVMIERLVHKVGVVGSTSQTRQAYLLYRYFWGKRQSALRLADDIIAATLPLTGGTWQEAAPLDKTPQEPPWQDATRQDATRKDQTWHDLPWPVDESERRLVQGFSIMEVDPSKLLLYMLLDRAERVTFRTFESSRGEDGRHGDVALREQPLLEQLTRIRPADVNRTLLKMYGEREAARCQAAFSTPDQNAYFIFMLKRGEREPVVTYERVLHIVKAHRMIAKIEEGGKRLKVHGPGNEVVRIVESIVKDIVGTPVIYEELRPAR